VHRCGIRNAPAVRHGRPPCAGSGPTRVYDEEVAAERRFIGALAVCCAMAPAQWHSPPAGIRSARTGKAVSILPGGRVVAPLGEQYPAGVQPLALAISASGKTLVAVDAGAGRPLVTVLEHDKNWTVRQLPAAYSNNSNIAPDLAGETSGDAWRTSAGLALSGERSAFVSEGTTGRVALIDLEFGEKRRTLDLNQAGNSGSFTGDLAFDAARNILYVADLAHSRVAVLDTRSRRWVASIQLEAVPLVLALGPDRSRLYVATARNLARGGAPSGSSVCVVDVAEPRQPRVAAVIRAEGWAASSLAELAVTTRNVFISDAQADSVTVVDAATNRVERQIPIRIPGCGGVRPRKVPFPFLPCRNRRTCPPPRNS
jgi:YVTN family beta-propeller protein